MNEADQALYYNTEYLCVGLPSSQGGLVISQNYMLQEFSSWFFTIENWSIAVMSILDM